MREFEHLIVLPEKKKVGDKERRRLRELGHVCPHCDGHLNRWEFRCYTAVGWMCRVCHLKAANVMVGQYLLSKKDICFRVGPIGEPEYPWGIDVVRWPLRCKASSRATEEEFNRQQQQMHAYVQERRVRIKKEAEEIARRHKGSSEAGIIKPYFDFESAYDVVLLAAMKGACKSKGKYVSTFIENEIQAGVRDELARRERRGKDERHVQFKDKFDGAESPSMQELEKRSEAREQQLAERKVVLEMAESLADSDVWFAIEQVELNGGTYGQVSKTLGVSFSSLEHRVRKFKKSFAFNFEAPK